MTLHDERIDGLTRVVLVTVVSIAKMLWEGRALLLPHAVAIFQNNYISGEGDNDLYLETGDGTLKFTAKWLMKQLIIHLQPHMCYTCVVKRVGTLLYPRNGDKKSLSLALFHSHIGNVSLEHEVSQPNSQKNTTSILEEAANVLNDIIHDQIRSLKDHTIDLTLFDFDHAIKKVNPILWKFVRLLTKSVRERTGKPGVDAHIKQVHRYFLVCLLMFATNASCSTALHYLVADTIEVCGN